MNKILVIADFAEQDPTAIARAVELAPVYGASLHIVYFCYEDLRGVKGDADLVKSKVMETLKLNAQTQLDKLNVKNVEIDLDIVWEKNISLWVERYASEHQPKLVVKTGHRSETLFYTPTDWHLLRECPVPLLIVSEEKWRKARNVLAAVDLGSEKQEKQILNEKILAEAKHVASYTNSEVYVSYTVPFSPLLRDLGMQYTDELESDAKKALKGKIEQLSAQYDIPVENFDIHAGQPGKVIMSTAARYKAGTVVIGVVGNKGIAGKLMGNTAEEILELLKSDVLALKP